MNRNPLSKSPILRKYKRGFYGMMKRPMNGRGNRFAIFFLRLGLAFVFLYAAISAFINPDAWTGFLPTFLRAAFPAKTILMIFSVSEVALSLWLFSGRSTRFAAAIAALMLLGIVLTNLKVLDLTFRDVGLFFAALALMTITRS